MPKFLVTKFVTKWRGLGAAMAAVLALSAGTGAHAAAYRGAIDPPYGAPFVTPGFTLDLGWRGEVEFFLPAQCDPPAAPLPGDRNNSADCNNEAVVQSAFIELFNVNGAGQPTLETLIFDASSMNIVDIRYKDNGEPTGLRTSESDLIYSPLTDTLFALVFALDQYDDPSFDLSLTTSGPLLLRTDCTTDSTGPGEDCGYIGANDYEQFPPTVLITRIPEPASLLLAMLGLFAVVAGGPRPSPSVWRSRPAA